MKITGAQIRMARAFLRWSIADLARSASVADSTVKRIEQVDGPPEIGEGVETTRDYRAAERADTLGRIVKALAEGGITFLPDDGRNGAGIRGKVQRR